ncbi:MAG: ABC transporter permease [Deltaproteobacteria bacterium]|nr:MAG: ABC transporter permease [Deltaproteobacteria bacterium]
MTLGMRVRGIGEKPDVRRVGEIESQKDFISNSLLLGDELASTLRVHPDFNENMKLIFPLGDVGPTGDMIPHVRDVHLTGLFHSGYYDFDHKYGLISYQEARKLFGVEGKQGFEVWFENIHETENIKKQVQSIIAQGSPLAAQSNIETWTDQNPKLFAALRLERIGMGALLGVLLLVASFNIFSVLSLTVVEKKKDMGLLKALGLRQKAIRKIFLSYALRLAFWGGGVGGVLGLISVLIGIRYPIDLPPTYYIDKLPLSFSPSSLLFVLIVPFIVLAAAYYPAAKACEADPITALQREGLE